MDCTKKETEEFLKAYEPLITKLSYLYYSGKGAGCQAQKMREEEKFSRILALSCRVFCTIRQDETKRAINRLFPAGIMVINQTTGGTIMEPQKQFVTEREFKEEVFAMLKACFEAEVALDEATGRMTVALESGDKFAVTVEKLR